MTTQQIAVLAGLVTAALAVCGVAGILFLTPAPSVATLPPPMATAPPPTGTAIPTASPTSAWPPTWTPTLRPTPTPTPAGLTADEIAYWIEADKAIENYVMIWGVMILFVAGDDYYQLPDEERLESIFLCLKIIPVLSDEVRGLTPPARFIALHQELLAASSYFDRTAELITVALETSNTDHLDLDQMEKGIEALERAQTEVERYRAIVTELTCDCSADLYDCGDFKTQSQRTACYDRCRRLGYGDVHRLNEDGDDEVCEDWPP